MESQNDLFKEGFINPAMSKRKLLPWWIKVFIWIFLILSAIVPIAIVFGLLGYQFVISIYGLETNNPLSVMGGFLILIFILKGAVGYGLWFSKKWAVNVGVFDAVIGILLCLYTMFIGLFVDSKDEFVFTFRLELLLLIPYLIKLFKIKPMWNRHM